MSDASALTVLPIAHAGAQPVPIPAGGEILSSVFKIGPYTARLSYPGTSQSAGRLTVSWRPKPRGRLTPRQQRQYRAARDEFMRELSHALQRPITVIER